jgi:pyridoxal phosphate enzyme (YggS family)
MSDTTDAPTAAAAAVPPPPPEPSLEEIQEAFAAVQQNVAAAVAERTAAKGPSHDQGVRLVAVSKTKSAECTMNAYKCGARIFGENYAQEMVTKAPLLPEDAAWHFIGHLQSNKANFIVNGVPNLDYVETVDSEKLASKLNSAVLNSVRKDRPLNVLVQINTSGEDSKSGVSPSDGVAVAIAKHIVANCPALRLRGLMTIGMPDYTSTPANFECLRAVRSEVAAALGIAENTLELSMGMSGDYAAAISMGSTNVRVGSTIFGKRAKKPATPPQKPATPPKEKSA